MSAAFTFELAIGVYVSRSRTGTLSVFRLLDCSEEICHIARFETPSNFVAGDEALSALVLLIGHVRLPLRDLFLEGEPQLVGVKRLSFADLRCYAEFLQGQGATPRMIATATVSFGNAIGAAVLNEEEYIRHTRERFMVSCADR